MGDQRDKPFTPPVPRDHADATFSEMVPFRSKKINLLKSPLAIVAILCALVVPFLFAAVNSIAAAQQANLPPDQIVGRLQAFTFVAVLFITTLICVFVYLYVKPKRPIWAYVPAFAFSAAALSLPFLFEPYRFIFRTLPIGGPQEIMAGIQAGGFRAFYTMFFIAGLCEELLKATPILFGAWLSFRGYNDPRATQSGLYRTFHVRGPLDGALMGVFAGGGFVLMETGLEYVQNVMNNVMAAGGNVAQASTIALLVVFPRVLGAITGHMAYAGIFGYFIGLAVIRPRQKWKLLAIGYLSASLIHAIWNSFAEEIPFGYYFVAVISALGLAAVMLKARQLEVATGGASAETTGSIVVDNRVPPVMPAAPAGMPAGAPSPQPIAPAPVPSPQAAPPQQPAPPAAPAAAPAEALAINIDGMMLPLRAGGRLDLGAEPALGGRGAGIVGTIIPHPTRANVLGLRNEGAAGWRAKLRDGSEQAIEHDQSIRLAAGVEIHFADGLSGAVVKLG
ncbi:MAG: PrsW family intramembrane metalloprotease [Sphingomonas sp.]